MMRIDQTRPSRIPARSSRACGNASPELGGPSRRPVRQGLDALDHGACVHDPLVDVEGAREIVAQHLLADAQVLAHGEQDPAAQAALDQLDATPDRLAAPEAKHLEVDLVAAVA